MLIPLKIPPGVFRNGTNYQSAGRYYDANLVRFFEKTIRPVGGWMKAWATALTGKCRGMHAWLDNGGNRWCGIGTSSNLYAWNSSDLVDITPAGFTAGNDSSYFGQSYGFGTYNTGDYNESQTSTLPLEATTWSLDNWGQYLVGCSTGDGKLYEWQTNIASPAAAISGAPTGCRSLVVTPERHLVAIGASGDPRLVRWSDQDDNTEWTPSALTLAGDLNIQSNGKLLNGKRFQDRVLLWTDQDLHAMNYLGPPIVYGIQRVGTACGAISGNAMAVIDQGALWMGLKAFYIYDGSLVAPLPCDVSDFIFGDLNTGEGAKVYCGINHAFGEITWFYPSASSSECDRYVIFNYRENHWNIGVLARTSWEDAGVFPYPLAVSADNYLYEHENGWTDNGSAITDDRYLQAGPIELSPGDRVMQIRKVVPDDKTVGQVRMSFTAKFSPDGSSETFGPYSLTALTDVRFTGRQIAPKIEGVADDDWRVGTIRFDTVQGGLR